MHRLLAVSIVLLSLTPVAAQDAHVHSDRSGAALLPLPKEEGVFHFVIFGDRTGGKVEGLDILRQAVKDTNLLDPDLVMTVGDLVPGYNERDEWLTEMREYKGIMKDLSMPWFPAAGNHDVYWRGSPPPPGQHESSYEEHFGPLWYWFGHKNAAFFVLFTDEDSKDGKKGYGPPELNQFSDQQLAWLAKSLTEAKDYEHVLLFMHHPRWIGNYYKGSNWGAVHDLLRKAGNVTAVFGGHIHQQRHTGVKDGIEYQTLATTGGGIPFDIPGSGYLHHMNLVTVRKGGIRVATIPVGAVIDPKEMTPEHLDEVDKARRAPVRLTEGGVPVKADGSADGGASYTIGNPTARPIEVNVSCGATEGDWVSGPSHTHLKLEPGEQKEVRFAMRREADEFGSPFSIPEIRVQVDYLAEDRRISFPERVFQLPLMLTGIDAEAVAIAGDRCLRLEGKRSALRLPSDSFTLPDGPFTAEAWFRADRFGNQPNAIIGKTQASAFGVFLEQGKPLLLLHLGGNDYVRAVGTEPVSLKEWHHVAAVFDGKEARIYLDGKQVGATEASGKRTANPFPLYIGAEPDPAGDPGFWFSGAIDEVRISKSARYTGESFEPAKRHEPDAFAVVLLHLDGRIGPFHPDSSPTAGHTHEIGRPRFGRGVTASGQ